MAKRSTPTVRKRRLAATLRKLRERADVTPEEAMDVMAWSRSKLSKVETANMGVSVADVRVLCDLYATDIPLRDWLVETSRNIRRRGWWDAYDEAMTESFGDYVELESEATHAHFFEIDLVPGLLQTERYARSLMKATTPEAPDEVIDARTALRMARQQRLHDGEMSLWAVIDESALLRETGGVDVRQEQLRHLKNAGEQPNITVQILPLRTGSHAASGSPFGHLHFHEPVPSVVFTDNVAGTLYIEAENEVIRFRRAFEHLCSTALDAKQSQKLLEAALKETPF